MNLIQNHGHQDNYNGNDNPNQLIEDWHQFGKSITENRELNSKFYIYESQNRTLIERIKLFTNGDVDLCYNEVFPYFYKEIYGLEYNYGHAFYVETS